LLFVAFLSLTTMAAKSDSTRVYTEQNPLVYEDAWDLWPYAFFNDNGEPDGFNIDLIRLIMKELNIPYIIRLRPQQQAFEDLRDRKSDLMLGLAVGFHDQYGLYGNNAITLFTQSVAAPKGKPTDIKTFRDLGKEGIKVIVNPNSMSYHLMIDYGWEENAIPSSDLREVIQQVSAHEDGQIVWNTLSLKWLMNRYHIDNLQLTPVNMPHGEYKFMSNDQQLLDRLDEAYTKLYTADKITPLQDKWFYPERLKPETPQWIWYALGIALLLIVFASAYAISYRIQSNKLNRQNLMRNRRLALILQTSQVRIWTYDIVKDQFAWCNDNGQVAYTYSMEEFSQRYSPEDSARLKAALNRLAKGTKNNKEEELTLSLRAKDVEDGDTDLRDYYIVLSVLRRDKEGKPRVIIGTKKDVTKESQHKRDENDRALRYWSIFYTPIVGIMYFDKEGKIVNINPKACEMFCCEAEEIIAEKASIRDILGIGDMSLESLDGFYATHIIDLDKIPDEERTIKSIKAKGKLYNEFKLMTVYDDSEELLGIFAFTRDITTLVSGFDQEQERQREINEVTGVLDHYGNAIDTTIGDTDIRLIRYSPGSHTLTIFNGTDKIQHRLTQTRCMALVGENSKRAAMRLLTDMDDRADKVIEHNIQTALRAKGGNTLTLYFKLKPNYDKDGNVKEYLGLLRDISELMAIEKQMAIETAKVQEVENTKNSFVKNMVQDIKEPMNTVMGYVSQIGEKAPTDNEEELCQGIAQNADYLLHLIDNILYLSRLEARMVDIKKEPCNFAEIFEEQCATGWMKYKNAETRYIVENPYEQLTIDIDAGNLGQAIAQIAANAAQHTKSGVVKARYDYIGRRLIISIDDTGEGIPAEQLDKIKQEQPGGAHTTKGLGLAITKELISQMEGTLEIMSEEGSGTTVYITIPCHASVVKRNKLA
jgi:PAS domain S-box-containing protein